MIHNRRIRVPRGPATDWSNLRSRVEEQSVGSLLRWSIAAADATGVEVEATILDQSAGDPVRFHRLQSTSCLRAVVSLVPTGVGCSIGGFAGDAGPATRLLAATCDVLVTNPNALNASDFISLPDKVWYTEGFAIDALCSGALDLWSPPSNRIGLVVECADEKYVNHALNVANAIRATHGVDIIISHVTGSPIGTRCRRNSSGAYVGTVDDVAGLRSACRAVLDHGADAIAITTDIRDVPAQDHADHFDGRAPNPLGGAEAVVSHLVSREFGVPCAHAPLVNRLPASLTGKVVDPRGAGEAVSRSGLACILIGLARAPRLCTGGARPAGDTLGVQNVVAIVAPATALGAAPICDTRNAGIPVIAVRENRTLHDVSQSDLQMNAVLEVDSYLEAAGILLAMREGLAIESVRRPLRTVKVERGIAALEGIR